MKRIVSIFMCFACLCFCVGCSDERRAEDMLIDICSELELPAGETYLCGAEEGSEGYLPEDTMGFMYGKDAKERFSLLEDYAIYISSFAAPYEVAVLKCRSVSDTDTLAAMCLERADCLKVLLRDTEYAELARGARIYTEGRFVVMIMGK